MRLSPHRIYLMALQGWRTLHDRQLLTPEEAREQLRRLTGADFGIDAEAWSVWIRANGRGLYRHGPVRGRGAGGG